MKEPSDPGELQSADSALAIMKSWRWVRCDPDGVLEASPVDLASAMSRLAFYGHRDPKSALLTLLCERRIEARGDYIWAKLQNGEEFRLEGSQTAIEPIRWQALRAALHEHTGDYTNGEYVEALVTLDALGRENEPTGEWEPKYDRFSYALLPKEISPYETGYFEEFFAAQSIYIMPLAFPGPDGEIVGIADEATEVGKQSTQDETKRGRKPKYDWPAATLAIFGLIYRATLSPKFKLTLSAR